MSKSVKTRVCLSIDVKNKILEEVSAKVLSKTEISKKYGIPKSTLSTIIKGKEKTKDAHNLGVAASRKYSRDAKYPQLEKALTTWLRKMKGLDAPVDGALLKTKAEVFAGRLHLTEFKCSDGWLQKFKIRHGLSFKKVCGESGAVDQKVTKEWKETQLKTIISKYAPEDIYNADETGLFYKLLPEKTLAFKGETCSGSKKAKERITVLLGANMTGSDKLPLLIIGKSKKPRCFKNLKSFPTKWEANKKAWMTSDIFKKWLKALDEHFTQRKKKIVLVFDNCTAHPRVLDLTAIRLEFLPPNATSVLQPMDQGIIQNFKINYRRMLLRRVVLDLENDQIYKVDILAAMHLAVRAWDQVKDITIANCFRHAGFFIAPPMAPTNWNTNTTTPGVTESDAMEDKTLMDAFRKKNAFVPEALTFEEFSNVDKNTECIEEISDDDIIQDALESDEKDELSDDDDKEIPARPTSKEAINAVSVLRRYFEAGDSDIVLIDFDSIEKGVFKSVSLKQTKISKYFFMDK